MPETTACTEFLFKGMIIEEGGAGEGDATQEREPKHEILANSECNACAMIFTHKGAPKKLHEAHRQERADLNLAHCAGDNAFQHWSSFVVQEVDLIDDD